MKFIPNPKHVEEKAEAFKKAPLSVSFEGLDPRLTKAFSKLPLSEDGIKTQIKISGKGGDAYRLSVTNESIEIDADSDAAVFCAIQTLRQIYADCDARCCYIDDAPDFAYRGFYHDVTRGKIPKTETLKALIDRLAYCKCNSLQIYVEHTFDFKELALTKEITGYLTAEDIRELDDYCYENFIEFVPSLSTFGHLYMLLQNNGFNRLSLLPDYTPARVDLYDRQGHHTLDPLNDESFELVKSLIDQYLPLFRSNKFNICCDETFDLDNGKYKDMNPARLYVDFVKKIVNYVQSCGKTVMMWDDILQMHMEYIDELPDGVIFLTWGYDPNVEEQKITNISNLKKPQVVCPGISAWNGFCEKPHISEINIAKMASFGKKHGSMGLLNTNWGDLGHLAPLELTMYGMSVGLELSWNSDTPIDKKFDSCVDKIIYDEDGMSSTVRELALLHSKTDWPTLIMSYINDGLEPENHYVNPFGVKAVYPSEEYILSARADIESFIARVKSTHNPESRFTKDVLLAAEAFLLVNELTAKYAGYSIERKISTKKWLESFKSEWMERNLPSEFYNVEAIFLGAEG